MVHLDDTDLQILKLLQTNAQLTIKEIAAQINLSITPVHDRIKKLEREGIIEKYVTGTPVNAIKMELESFYKSIMTNTPVIVSLHDAESALKVVHEIELQINQSLS